MRIEYGKVNVPQYQLRDAMRRLADDEKAVGANQTKAYMWFEPGEKGLLLQMKNMCWRDGRDIAKASTVRVQRGKGGALLGKATFPDGYSAIGFVHPDRLMRCHKMRMRL